MAYDIFISYKRKSLATANNLYYRLTMRGYSAFFDLEEMGRDNFNVQLLNYIESSKDVFVLLEEGSLDSCISKNCKDDWFCIEIAHALKTKRNIIPILIGGFKMPGQDFFPDELKELSFKNAPEFSFSFFEEYLNKIIEKGYITSKAEFKNQSTSIFKFYSNENCQVFKEGKLVCSLEGMSDEPYYLPVQRKGDYRFKCKNSNTAEEQILKEHIDVDEEKEIDIQWDACVIDNLVHVPSENSIQLNLHKVCSKNRMVSGDTFTVELGNLKFDMIRVEGGDMKIGATKEQETFAENNEYPAHSINLPSFYIGKFPVTQNLWEKVMGYNKSHFQYQEKVNVKITNSKNTIGKVARNALVKVSSRIKSFDVKYNENSDFEWDRGHYPAENLTYDDASEFVRRLSEMTNIKFDLPTEGEWEYAARGGHKSGSFLYAGSNNIEEVAWYKGNSKKRTHPVGEKKPNELGIYDMCGNVWEWTKTPAHSYASDIELDGTIFVRRGGSWWHEDNNCRVSRRYASNLNKRTSGLGMRIVIRENIE